MNRLAFILGATLAATIPPAGHAADCLAYLAVDKALQAQVRVYRHEYEVIMSQFYEAEREATYTYGRQVTKAAKEAGRSDDEAWEMGRKAARERGQALKEAMRIDVQAISAPLEAAQSRARDAYIAAYENPAPDIHRETAGHDRDLVLKMAKAEREFCPK